MSYFILTVAVLSAVSQTIQGDYWHAAAWLIAGLGTFVNILDDAIIRDLKRENASLRTSRNTWAANARTNTILKHWSPNE